MQSSHFANSPAIPTCKYLPCVLNSCFKADLVRVGPPSLIIYLKVVALIMPPCRQKTDLERLISDHDLDFFNLNTLDERFNIVNDNCYSQLKPCKYYSPHSFNQLKKTSVATADRYNGLALLHNNIISLKENLESLQTHLPDEAAYHFNIIPSGHKSF